MKFTPWVLIAQMCTGSVCYADEPPMPLPPALKTPDQLKLVPIPEGEDHIIPLKKGQPAPFDGQLFENPTALRWGNYLDQAREKYRINMEYTQKLHIAELGYYTKLLSLEREKYNRVVPDLEMKLARSEYDRLNPPWYKTTWFGIVVGTVGTCAIVGLTAYTINATK